MALPTTGLTGHYDASTTSHLFKTFVSGGPNTGVPVDGDAIAAWTEQGGATQQFKQSASNALPAWRATTPLLPLPCLDFTGGQRLVVADNVGTAKFSSDVIANNAFTVLIAFYAESNTITASPPYAGSPLIGDHRGYWGLFLSAIGGLPKVTAYNWDTAGVYVTLDCSVGAAHVVMMRHQSGTLYCSLDGGAEVSLTAGNTGDMTGNVLAGAGTLGGNLDGRIGEIAIYNTALTGTNLTDAVSYFTGRWLPAVSTTPVNLSQLPIEVLRGPQPLPALRLSQLPLEILRGPQPLPVLRLSQLPIEVLRSPGTAEVTPPSTTPAHLSQLPIEILRGSQPLPALRLSQLPIEILHQLPPPPLAVTQLVVETLDRIPNSPAAVTQLVAEFLNQGLIHEARVTQLLCELIVIPRGLEACPPASDFPIDPATDTSGCAPALPIDPD